MLLRAGPTGTDYFHITTFRARPGEWKNPIRFPIDNAVRRLHRALRTDNDGRVTLHGDDERR